MMKEVAIDITRNVGNCVLTVAGVDITSRTEKGVLIRARNDNIRGGVRNAAEKMATTGSLEQVSL